MLKDVDAASVRSTQANHNELIERITILKTGIEGEVRKLSELDANIDRLHQKLRAASPRNLDVIEARTRLLRDSASVFTDAVEAYKSNLRTKVEASASRLFLAMTTEKAAYARLRINDDYGLTIIHRDGRPEEARSAGAEHVVALALMGALQNNAPLRGPIVMDSPFGRLDEQHTSNVVSALHLMAEQVVLLVYESEIGRRRARELLGSRLISEYELERVSSRRTNISKVQ
jgi:DNA sulfur modification protein DndD